MYVCVQYVTLQNVCVNVSMHVAVISIIFFQDPVFDTQTNIFIVIQKFEFLEVY